MSGCVIWRARERERRREGWLGFLQPGRPAPPAMPCRATACREGSVLLPPDPPAGELKVGGGEGRMQAAGCPQLKFRWAWMLSGSARAMPPVSSHDLKISTDGESTTSVGNLFQWLITHCEEKIAPYLESEFIEPQIQAT